MRWVDLDAQGHANNALIPKYCLQAWADFLQAGGQAQLLPKLTVLKCQVQYLAPISFSQDPIGVVVQTLGVTSFRVRVEFTLTSQNRPVALVRATVGFEDQDVENPQSLPEPARDWFGQHQPDAKNTVLAKAVAPPPKLESVQAAKDQLDAGLAAEVDPLASLVAQEPVPDEPAADNAPGESDPFPVFPNWRVGEGGFVYEFPLRYSDISAHGHIGPITVFDIVAEARNRMHPPDESRTRMEEAAEEGIIWLVVRQDVEYLAPIEYSFRPLRVRTAFGRVGTTSLTLVAQVEDGGASAPCARTVTVLVCADKEGKPIPVPASITRSAALWPAEVAPI
jgi:acyl-CoA thioester hydrolase